MIPFTILLAVLSRRARSGVRDVTRLLWVAVLIAVGVGLLAVGARVAKAPDVNPWYPAGVRLYAIATFCEAYFLSSTLWLPRVFDRLEHFTAEMLVAVRQLRARKSGFLTAISFLAFLGVGLSSFGLCFTISIMGGFGNDLKRKILGNNAHVVVDRENQGFADWQTLLRRIQAVPGVQSATPLVQGEVMVTSQTNLSGVILRGIDARSAGATVSLRRDLVRGRVDYLLSPERLLNPPLQDRRPIQPNETDAAAHAEGAARTPETTPPPPVPTEALLPPNAFSDSPGNDVLPGLLIGRELAQNLHLAVGDEVRVVSPFGGMVTPAGTLPKTRSFRVAGIFYSGMYEYDTKYAYVTIPIAQNFFNYEGDKITSIEVRLADVDRSDAVAEAIRPMVHGDGWRVRDWKELNQNLFRALRLEKLMMFVLLGVAIVVASFAIVATLLLLVIEKGREIAVMKAMGASDSFIARVFVTVGLLIGLVGSTLGVSTALLVCWLIQRVGIPLDPAVYYINRLPVFISPSDYALVAGLSIAVCLLATLYPAYAAARLRPVEGMRFG